MHSSRPLPLLLLILLLVSSAAPVIGCGHHCHKHRPTHHKGKTPKGPPVTVPPITVPPVLPYPPPPPASDTCPIDTLKLGACVDLLGGLIHIGLGNPVMDECCPVLQGLAELEAAVCLCTTLRLKLLNLNIFVPIALQLLLTCGKSPPPGFTCSL